MAGTERAVGRQALLSGLSGFISCNEGGLGFRLRV